MDFGDVFELTAKSVLNNRGMDELQKIVEAVKDAKSIAFYPCNRYSRKVLKFLQTEHPEIFAKVVGAFDKSDNLNFMNGVSVMKFEKIHDIEIDKLIVTSSKFPSDLNADLDAIGFPPEKLFLTSLFHQELSSHPTEEVLEKVKKIAGMLADEKSRITYYLTWISLLLLDKSILSVFSDAESLTTSPDGEITYAGMKLSNIESRECQLGLALEIYKMEAVYPEEGDIVFDIGAYRGDTAAFFRKYVGEKGKVYTFEPDEINYNHLVENIQRNGMKNVIPIKKAVYNGKKVCNLIATPRSGSFLYVLKDEVDTNQITEINAVTLDDFVKTEKIAHLDFIKSDIEGCEMELLEGAQATIKKDSPKLAIAIYHSISDLLNIPLYVHDMNRDYKIYIRHRHMVNPWEIILYAKNYE